MKWLREGEALRIPLTDYYRIAEIVGREFGLQVREVHGEYEGADVHILSYGTPHTFFQLLWTRSREEFDLMRDQFVRYSEYLASERPSFVRTGDWA